MKSSTVMPIVDLGLLFVYGPIFEATSLFVCISATLHWSLIYNDSGGRSDWSQWVFHNKLDGGMRVGT